MVGAWSRVGVSSPGHIQIGGRGLATRGVVSCRGVVSLLGVVCCVGVALPMGVASSAGAAPGAQLVSVADLRARRANSAGRVARERSPEPTETR